MELILDFFLNTNNSNSFDSLRDGLNIPRSIERNKVGQKGLANVLNTLKSSYHIDDDAPAPSQPPTLQADSLFKSFANSNNPFLPKQENSKGNSMLELKQVPSGLF